MQRIGAPTLGSVAVTNEVPLYGQPLPKKKRLTGAEALASTPLGTVNAERLPEVLRALANLAEHNPGLALLHLSQLGMPPQLYGFAIQRVDAAQTGPVTQQELPKPTGEGLRLTLDPKVQAAWEVSAFGLKSFIQPNVLLDFGEKTPRFGAKERAEVFKAIAAEVRGEGPNDQTFWEYRAERAGQRIMERFPKLQRLELRLHVSGFGEVRKGEGVNSVRDRSCICTLTRQGDGSTTTRHGFEVREAHRALQILGHAIEPRDLYYRAHYRGQAAEGPDYWVLQRFMDQAILALSGGQVGPTGLGLKDAKPNPLLRESEADRRAFAQDLSQLQARVKARLPGPKVTQEEILRIALEEIAQTLKTTQHPALVEVRRTVGSIELGSHSVAALPYGGERSAVPEALSVGPFTL